MKTNKQEVVESLMAEHTNEEGLLEFGKYDHQEFEQALQTAYEAGREASSELDEFIINNALWERDREWQARINNPNNSK